MADKVKVEKDANNAINMYAGADQFLNIGEPDGAGMRGRVSVDQLWKEQVATHFPPSGQNEAGKSGLVSRMGKFPEQKVDAMRKQKDEDLERYKKEIERQRQKELQKQGDGSKMQSGSA